MAAKLFEFISRLYPH